MRRIKNYLFIHTSPRVCRLLIAMGYAFLCVLLVILCLFVVFSVGYCFGEVVQGIFLLLVIFSCFTLEFLLGYR